MPLYLVRWANLSAAIVKADDEHDLLDHLDMVGDSTGASWKIYDGPLHVEFDLKIPFTTKKPGRSAADVVFGELPDDPLLVQTSSPSTDAVEAMLEEIYEYAFPHLLKLCREVEYPTDEQIKEATLRELERYLHASWQRDQLERSDDPDAKLAVRMGASLKWVKSVLARKRGEDAPKQKKPRKPRKK